jgi:hypothetical protein
MKTKNKKIVSKKTCLCPSCEGQVFGLLNELKNQAVKQKRGGLILDSIGDLEISLIDGTIERVQQRDSAWSSGRGKKFGRRFHVEIK